MGKEFSKRRCQSRERCQVVRGVLERSRNQLFKHKERGSFMVEQSIQRYQVPREGTVLVLCQAGTR